MDQLLNILIAIGNAIWDFFMWPGAIIVQKIAGTSWGAEAGVSASPSWVVVCFVAIVFWSVAACILGSMEDTIRGFLGRNTAKRKRGKKNPPPLG